MADEFFRPYFTMGLWAQGELAGPLVQRDGGVSPIVEILALTVVFSRRWTPGARMMSLDESLHVYYSWQLATRKGFAHNLMLMLLDWATTRECAGKSCQS